MKNGASFGILKIMKRDRSSHGNLDRLANCEKESSVSHFLIFTLDVRMKLYLMDAQV